MKITVSDIQITDKDILRLEAMDTPGIEPPRELRELRRKREKLEVGLLQELSGLLEKNLPSIVEMAKDNFDFRYELDWDWSTRPKAEG
eukprot:s1039_g23.t1